MTIKAVAWLTGVGTDFAAGNYNVSFSYGVTDGTVDNSAGGLSQIPFPLSDRNSNKKFREDVAAKILADSGWVIDPKDIYIPFSN